MQLTEKSLGSHRRRSPAKRIAAMLAVFLAAAGLQPALASGPQAAVSRTLKNGLKVIIVPHRLAPVVSVQVNYRVGSNQAPPGFPGMAHAQEHMMFRGSPGLSAQQLAAITAAMGGRTNAETRADVTRYFFTVPAADLETALRVEALRMRSVDDSDAQWRTERGAIEQEVQRDLSSPTYRMYALLLEGLFGGTPYAHDALGTRASFDRTTGAMLKKFYRNWYAPNNAVLVIVGDVSVSGTLAMVKRLFEPIPERRLPPRRPIKTPALEPEIIRFETDLPYGLAVVAYRLPGDDSRQATAADILARVINSRRAALYDLVARGKALFAEFSTQSFAHAGMGFVVAGFPKGADGQGLVKEIREIMGRYAAKGVPPALVAAAKRYAQADAEFSKNDVETLASQWSDAVAVAGLASPEAYWRDEMRVQPSEVNAVARSWLVNATAITAVLTPGASGKAHSAGKGYHGRESFTPAKLTAVPLPAWARELESPPQLPPPPPQPYQTTLANGIRLIVQPESISDTVSVYGRIKQTPALEEPPGKEGIAEVLDEMLSYGSRKMGRLAFERQLDAIAARLEPGARFSLNVLSRHFKKGVHLLAENLLDPPLTRHVFKIVRRQVADAVAGRINSPAYKARRALYAGLYPPKDPTLRQATVRTVNALRLSDVIRYYRHTFRPDLTTIVVVGHIQPARAQRVIAAALGSWRAAGAMPETDLGPVPPNPPGYKTIPDPGRVQDSVLLAQTLALTRDNPDYDVLQIGMHVLSGGFYATRLYRDLREKTGLVYTVGAGLEAGVHRAVFMVAYGCDPQNVTKARDLILKNLRQMQQQPVTEQELVRAQRLLIIDALLNRASVDSIAGGYLDLAVLRLPLNAPQRAARHILKTSAGQVRRAFGHYLRPDAFVQVVRGPEPR